MPTSPRHSTTKPLLTSVGAAGPYTPNEQHTSSYISERKRQRRQRRDDTKLRHHPTENPACRPKRKIHRRVSRFLARFSVLFPCGRSTPPEAWTSPIYPLISLRTVKKQTRRNSRRVLICQKVSQSSRRRRRRDNARSLLVKKALLFDKRKVPIHTIGAAYSLCKRYKELV